MKQRMFKAVLTDCLELSHEIAKMIASNYGFMVIISPDGFVIVAEPDEYSSIRDFTLLMARLCAYDVSTIGLIEEFIQHEPEFS